MYQDQESTPLPPQSSSSFAPAPKEQKPKPFDKNGQTWVDEVYFSSWFEGKHVTQD